MPITPTVGMLYAGGQVFYVNSTEEYALIVGPDLGRNTIRQQTITLQIILRQQT